MWDNVINVVAIKVQHNAAWPAIPHRCFLSAAPLNMMFCIKSKAFRIISSPPITECVLLHKFRRNAASLAVFIAVFMLPACLNGLTACGKPPCVSLYNNIIKIN